MKRFKIRKWLKRIVAGSGRLAPYSDTFHSIIGRDARIERVATGYLFTEGPVWWSAESSLLFSDIPGDCIYRYQQDGNVAVWRSPSGRANGLTFDRSGALIACEHGARRVTRTGDDGAITVVADRAGGKRLNSPNDVVVMSNGALYFTDPPYGIEPHEQEQPVQGVYRIPPEGGDPQLVADDFERPNGLAFSPDEMLLHVDDSSPDRKHVRVFDVAADGTLSNSRVFVDMKAGGKGTPDGMKVDRAGNLYCTGPGGVWLITPDGEHVGTIRLPEPPSNCAWGGSDLHTLYITAVTSLYRLTVEIPGLPPCGKVNAGGAVS